MDNLHLLNIEAHSMLHLLSKAFYSTPLTRKLPLFAASIDLKKVFDSISRGNPKKHLRKAKDS